MKILATIIVSVMLGLSFGAPANATSADVNAYFPKSLCNEDGTTTARFAMANLSNSYQQFDYDFSYGNTWGQGGIYMVPNGKVINKYILDPGETLRVTVYHDNKVILSGTRPALDCG